MTISLQSVLDELSIGPLSGTNLFAISDTGTYKTTTIRRVVIAINSFKRIVDLQFLLAEYTEVVDVSSGVTSLSIQEPSYSRLLRITSDQGPLFDVAPDSNKLGYHQTGNNSFTLINPTGLPINTVNLVYSRFSATTPSNVPQSYTIQLLPVFRIALTHYINFLLSSPGSVSPESQTTQNAFVQYAAEMERLKTIGIEIPIVVDDVIVSKREWGGG